MISCTLYKQCVNKLIAKIKNGLQKSLQKKLVSSTHSPLTTNHLPLEAL